MMRKTIALFFVLVLVLGISSAVAEQTITVNGSGETLVTADTAVVSVGVNVRKKDALEAQAAANEVIASIRAVLTEAGLKEEDISTGYINLYAVYDYSKDVEEIVAYSANSSLAIKVTDMGRVGEVIDLAFGAGANTLDGVQFSVSDDAAAREQAMKKAVEDAKTKAAILAEAAGIGELEVKSVQDGNVYSYESGINNFSMKVGGAVTEDALSPTLINAAKISVTASVTIVFEAK